MVDYYKILGVHRSAGAGEIRAAYKRQAMAHHPDHNPGNPREEDLFKIINEAYHVLSDPRKREQYDRVLHRPDWKGVRDLDRAKADYMRRVRDIRVQQYMQWRRAGGKTYEYRIDREYFRIMGITFAVFALIAALSTSLFYYSGYLRRITPDRTLNAEAQIATIEQLFRSGRVEESLREFRRLPPSSQRRYDTLSRTMMNAVGRAALAYYEDGDYRMALNSYLLRYEFEHLPSASTWTGIGLCKMRLGLYDEGEAALRLALRKDYRQEAVICRELGHIPARESKKLAEQICNDY